jgi:hypothetical protein
MKGEEGEEEQCKKDTAAPLPGHEPEPDPAVTMKINKTMQYYGLQNKELKEQLHDGNIFRLQQEDDYVQKIVGHIRKEGDSPAKKKFFLKNNILYYKGSSPYDLDRIVIPQSLVPTVLAFYHLQSHSGARKLFLTISQRYVWKAMRSDCEAFVKGCVLCSVLKTKNEGRVIVGTGIASY